MCVGFSLKKAKMKNFITRVIFLSWLPYLYVITSLEHQQPDDKPNQISSISNKTLINMVKYINSAVDTKKSFLNNEISSNKTMENNEHTSVRIGKRELLVLLYTAKVLTIYRSTYLSIHPYLHFHIYFRCPYSIIAKPQESKATEFYGRMV